MFHFCILLWETLNQKLQRMLICTGNHCVTLLFIGLIWLWVWNHFQHCCLLNSHPNGGWACAWMAPFSFLIDGYWVQSGGSSLLTNTQEETAAKTVFFFFFQIALWTSGLRAADKLRLCMVAYCSAPLLPSSAQSKRPCGIYKVNTEV